MEYRRFGDTVYVRIDRGEEIARQLQAVAEAESIRLAQVSALGATDDFTVGVYDVDTRQYHSLTFRGPHEIVALTGTISTMDGVYYSHLHMGCADTQGRMVGGHLNRAVVSATCEAVITVSHGTVDRVYDQQVTGLNLFRFS